jgi:hypothetical protein
MFRYRLHSPDGDDLGEAAYAMQIHADVPDSKTRPSASKGDSAEKPVPRTGTKTTNRSRSRLSEIPVMPVTERRRSRTYLAVGCMTVRILKTRWATGPGRSAASVPSYLSPSR